MSFEKQNNATINSQEDLQLVAQPGITKREILCFMRRKLCLKSRLSLFLFVFPSAGVKIILCNHSF